MSEFGAEAAIMASELVQEEIKEGEDAANALTFPHLTLAVSVTLLSIGITMNAVFGGVR